MISHLYIFLILCIAITTIILDTTTKEVYNLTKYKRNFTQYSGGKMKDTAVIIMHIPDSRLTEDLEVPLHITANELIEAVAQIYSLTIDGEVTDYYLKAERPTRLVRGAKTLRELGLRDGTEMWIWNH